MRSLLPTIVLSVLALGCTSREPETPPPARPSTPQPPETSAEARIDQATQSCVASRQADDCQKGAQVLATLIVELADGAELPVEFDKEMDEVQEQLQTAQLTDPALAESLLVAYRLVNDDQDFERTAVGSQAEMLEAFRARTGAARAALHSGQRKACVKELLASLLLITRPAPSG